MAKYCWAYTALLISLCLLSLLIVPARAETFAILHASSDPMETFPEGVTAGNWVQVLDTIGEQFLVASENGSNFTVSADSLEIAEVHSAMMGFVSNPGSRSFLNLRDGPAYTANVLNVFYNGVPCVLLSEQDGWLRVRVNGEDGYFRKEYVSVHSAPFGEKVVTVSTPQGTGLNLRYGPGYSYRAVGQLESGTYLILLQKGSQWWMVSDGTQTGFILSDFVKEGIMQPEFFPSDSTVSAYALVTNPKSTQVLNLRKRPGKGYESIGQYSNGARLTVLNQGLEWCKVAAKDGKVGYMMTEFLTLYNAMDTPTMSVVQEDRTFVNLRDEPSLNAHVLCEIPHGTKVIILSPDESWFRVRYNNFTGYIAASFLQ